MAPRTKTEYRAIIRYNFLRSLSVDQCFEEMSPVLGDIYPHRTTIFRWHKQFQRGKFDLEDDPHTGQPPTAVTSENITTVEELLNESRHITCRQI